MTGVVLSAIVAHPDRRSVVLGLGAVFSQSLAGGAEPELVCTLKIHPSAVIFGEHHITAVAILFVLS